MPQVQDFPTGIGSIDGWGLGAGASKVAAVGTNDGDTSYIFSASNGANQRYTFANLPSDADSPVTSCKFGAVMRQVAGTPTGYIFNGTLNMSIGAVFSSYTFYEVNSDSLVKTTINGFESGVALTGLAGREVNCTLVYRITNYTVTPPPAVPSASGGFIAFFSVLLPLLGVGATFMQFRRAVRDAFPATRFAGWELQCMWSDWLVWTRPHSVGMTRPYSVSVWS